MMVESAMACARGRMKISELKEQLAGIQTYNHHLAPPEGLYLARVLY